MPHYNVLIASQKYKNDKPLTYSSQEEIKVGTIVKVPLRNQPSLGIVVEKLVKKSATALPIKEIQRVISEIPVPPWYQALAKWSAKYYAVPSSSMLATMLPSALMQKPREINSMSNAPTVKKKNLTKLPNLTDIQATAHASIQQEPNKPFLLHGITGSGKTRVYLELCKSTLEKNKSVVVLTPEIGLTPQLTEHFLAMFPNQVLTTHSALKPSQRRDLWLTALHATQPKIIIGPRSALFMPLKEIGLIIIDECHDDSYHQDQAPQYHANIVAAALRNITDCTLVLGSATPNIQDYYVFKSKNLPIISMPTRALTSTHQQQHTLIDTTDRSNFSTSSWISNRLIESIATSLKHKQQSLVFLNRRGSARLIECSQCHWFMSCTRCDIPLTYHNDQHRARCHTCGFSAKPVTSCVSCASTDIIMKSLGTKAIEQELHSRFPSAQIARFDSDNLSQDSLQSLYKKLHGGAIDILVGTQIISKGLDLPKLRTIGVIQADNALLFPDYRAKEHAFQQLTQLIGRVGRGHTDSDIVLQTHNPNNPVFIDALEQRYSTFYEQELNERSKFQFPPFCHILKITISRASTTSAEKTALNIAEQLRSADLPITILGPAPSFKTKTHNKYHWHLIIKATKRSHLLTLIKQLPANTKSEIDPINLL
jgi:primosomal protein N' (replication factor Y) (superfamily II helicase)